MCDGLAYMTKEELLLWAERNNKKYPILKNLQATVIGGEDFIYLPIKYGAYDGIYFKLCCKPFVFCVHPTVLELRRKSAVGLVKNCDAAQTLLLECIKNLEKEKNRN
jgi:hypothetical protein